MTTYRPIDSKREEFRKYLEKAGVMDALTKVLVSLYEEADKPDDALDYVRKNLGDNRPDMAEFETMQAQLEELKARNQELEDEVSALKVKLGEEEPPPDQPPEEGAAEPDADAEPAPDADAAPEDAPPAEEEAPPPEEA